MVFRALLAFFGLFWPTLLFCYNCGFEISDTLFTLMNMPPSVLVLSCLLGNREGPNMKDAIALIPQCRITRSAQKGHWKSFIFSEGNKKSKVFDLCWPYSFFSFPPSPAPLFTLDEKPKFFQIPDFYSNAPFWRTVTN